MYLNLLLWFAGYIDTNILVNTKINAMPCNIIYILIKLINHSIYRENYIDKIYKGRI